MWKQLGSACSLSKRFGIRLPASILEENDWSKCSVHQTLDPRYLLAVQLCRHGHVAAAMPHQHLARLRESRARQFEQQHVLQR